MKEARDFIRSLKVVFALAPDTYVNEQDRTLYGVIFLVGEPRETWHQNHNVDQLEDYSWSDFRRFVLDAVEDPVSRLLSVTVAYEAARQIENQTVQAFASELATLEEQTDAYTPAQRTRHLLAKLKLALRKAIITVHQVPKRREDLVSLATRLESASGRSPAAQALPKRSAGEQSGRGGAKRRKGFLQRQGGSQPQSQRQVGAMEPVGDAVVCWGCNEPGHYKSACPNKQKWDKENRKASTRKVAAAAEPAKPKKGEPADKAA